MCFSFVLFPVGGWGCLPPPGLVDSGDRLGLWEEVVAAERDEDLEERPSWC